MTITGKPEKRALVTPLDATEKGFGGLAALYYDGTPNTEARMGADLVERFLPGAFRDWYAQAAECFCFFNHDEEVLLGRRSAGLQVTEDERGLSYFVAYDPTDPDHTRVASKIKRGDVRGSSIIFVAESEDYRKENGVFIREISRASVLELGPTPYPVYEGTTAETRSSTLAELRARAAAACVEPPTAAEFDLLFMGYE